MIVSTHDGIEGALAIAAGAMARTCWKVTRAMAAINGTALRSAVEGRQESLRYCLVVIPTYNEVATIGRLLGELLALGPQFDALVVDDASPDGTADVVLAMAAQTPRVQLLRRSGKLGLGSAYVAGFRHGLGQGYRYLGAMDADFSHEPGALSGLLQAVERRADLAIGSRYTPGGEVVDWPLGRRLLSRGGSLYARGLLQLPFHDLTGGFKCFRAEALRAVALDELRSSGYAFQIELTYRLYQAGMAICELPIRFSDRVAGQSKMSYRIVAEAALLVLRLWAGSGRPFARRGGPALKGSGGEDRPAVRW
jgi:dolichol-phosphate mannosyltransferase